MPRSSPLSNQGGAWQTLRSDRGQQLTLRHARKSRPDRGTSVRPAQPAAGADRAATLRCVDERDRKAVHERWAQRQSRRPDTLGYREEWYFQQCGGCLHWLALAGKLGDDWGVCASASSPYDGIARFEHDGCDQFAEDIEGFGVTRASSCW